VKEISFNKADVAEVSKFLQDYMAKKKLQSMTADECAILLANHHTLGGRLWPQGPKIGFIFRQMLRDGRDGRIQGVRGPCLVTGATQKGGHHTRWCIARVAE